MKKQFYPILMCYIAILALSCNQKPTSSSIGVTDNSARIVSLNGTITEILCSLGLESKIQGVDVTSTYPESVTKLPKVGHNRDMSAEAIMGLKPTLVIGLDDNIKPELKEQLRAANIRLMLFHLDHSIAGAKSLIAQVADSLGSDDKAAAICKGIDADTVGTMIFGARPKVLFIYARGAGTMLVAGKENAVNSMIVLAGGQNAIKGFDDYKPLTSEALVTANPDVILMFDKGLESVGGLPGLLQVQGIAQTNAGKNKKIIEMDGQLLTGFGPRVGKGLAELSKKLNAAEKP
ncbi:MAG: ABC transporter substrate-binding protein [Flavipsychrobacter sp.]|nr:ABC transporter substrate-binding protein [Flavipsychrobacter sp.]